MDPHNSIGAENGSSSKIAGVIIRDLTKETYKIEFWPEVDGSGMGLLMIKSKTSPTRMEYIGVDNKRST